MAVSESDVQLALLAEAAPLRVAAEPFVCFEIAGTPKAWERPGATIRWGNGRPYIHWYVTAEEARWREQIAWVAKSAMRGKKPASGPLAMVAHAFLPIPESWHWLTKQKARSGALLPTGKPDHDNLLKCLCDALTQVVWTDDALVIDGRCIKRFSDKPALRIEIREYISSSK